MASEEWISFRGHMFDFQDFLEGWVGKLKAAPINMVSSVAHFIEYLCKIPTWCNCNAGVDSHSPRRRQDAGNGAQSQGLLFSFRQVRASR
jgi:hypothetical protein